MARLFISHSSVNDAAAIALRDWLFELGFRDDVFLDIDPQRGLAAGERWQQALKAAADRCEAVLFLVSPAWLASAWCRAEFLLAKTLQKRIFGLIIEPVPLDQVPAEMTAEWQVCELAGEDRLRTFDVDVGVKHERITFREAGLEVLRRGLERAGLDARSFPWPPANEPKRAPYRGLRSLEPQDAAIFFGRDAAIVRGLDCIRGLVGGGIEELLVVLGASGSGKSSFLRAGLWPRLARDDAKFLPLPVIRPETAVITGAAGLAEAIAATFERVGSPRKLGDVKDAIEAGLASFACLLEELGERAKRRLVAAEDAKANPVIILSIDQAEELFNADGRAEAERFLALLAGVLAPVGAAPHVLAIATIRSDRYELLQANAHLAEVKQALFNLAPMPSAEFKSVIEGPARRVVEAGGKLEIEPALSEQLITDAQGVDALPLLAFSLEALYRDNRSAERLTLADYARLGGVKGSITAAVARALAEPAKYPSIPADAESQYASLRATFIPWLARIDMATNTPMRRVAQRDEIAPTSAALLERLLRERLLVVDRRDGADVVEIAHESLLRQWPALASWLEADADNLKLIDAVELAASEWARNDRRAAWLDHRAERLAAAEKLATRDDFRRRLGEQGTAYLRACRTRQNAEQRRQTLFNHLVRAAAVIISIVAGVALWQWSIAETQTAEANNQRKISSQRAALLSANLADNLLGQGDVDASLLLLLESAKSFDETTVPDKILIALQNAIEAAQRQQSMYVSANAKLFAVGRSVYIFDYAVDKVFGIDPAGTIKYLGSYDKDVLAIQADAAKNIMIVVNSDYNVDAIDLSNFSVRHLGILIGADEQKTAGDVAVTIYPDAVVLVQPTNRDDVTKPIYVMDLETGKALKTTVPNPRAFRYLTTTSGQRVFATANDGFVYAADAAFTSISRAQALDSLWSPIYLCKNVDPNLDDATKTYIAAHFEWVEFWGDHCVDARAGSIYMVHDNSTSAGTEYGYSLVDTSSGKSIDITGQLSKLLGKGDDFSELNTVDMISDDRIFAVGYNRDVYVFNDKMILRTKLSNTALVAKLLSKTTLLVAQKAGRQQKLTLFRLDRQRQPLFLFDRGQGSYTQLTAAEKAKLAPLNNGSCSGYREVFPNTSTIPNGSKLTFDTVTGSGTIKVETGNDVRIINLGTGRFDCIAVNGNFSDMLIRRDSGVDLYDFEAVLKTGDLGSAKKGSIVTSALSLSAFYVGDTDQIITSHWDNRVLRWRRTVDGYVSEEIFAGDYPVRYAEPDQDGKRLLIVEDYGSGWVGGILYSVNAHKEWIDLVKNYKYIGLAFASQGGIVFGNANAGDGNSNYLAIKTLSEYVSEARGLVSKDCLPAPTEDYTKSVCWPDLAAQ